MGGISTSGKASPATSEASSERPASSRSRLTYRWWRSSSLIPDSTSRVGGRSALADNRDFPQTWAQDDQAPRHTAEIRRQVPDLHRVHKECVRELTIRDAMFARPVTPCGLRARFVRSRGLPDPWGEGAKARSAPCIHAQRLGTGQNGGRIGTGGRGCVSRTRARVIWKS